MAIKIVCDICNCEIADGQRRFWISFSEAEERENYNPVNVLDDSISSIVSLKSKVVLGDICINCNVAIRTFVHNLPHNKRGIHVVK